ncbi:uncharacterized protein LOC119079544 [Bradysia coprophila]|uniref:uncharacterized protein LOC119079544 n=1 Tax=Bradysia coprophila TaxID=38358 RepID=UPI00187DA37B|nr:uncharacterized protein LOC119079544 [Bradysia coprophila]
MQVFQYPIICKRNKYITTMPSDRFYTKLAQRESGGDPTCVNEYGFMGLYQMGQPALQDVGYINNRGGWTGKDGIWSRDDFLNKPNIQTRAIRAYHNIVWNRYLPEYVRESVWRVINGVTLTMSGLIAGAHLVGHKRLAEYVRTKGKKDACDEIGTRCSEYVLQFGGY